MRAVSLQTEKIIKGNNRIYSALVGFNFLSCKVPESIKIKAPNAQNNCIPDQIVYPYLYHIKNRFFTGKTFKHRLFPKTKNIYKDRKLHQVKNFPYSRIGYIGLRADSSCLVDDTITLYIPKTNLKKITLKTNFDRIIIDATVIAKTSFGKTIASCSIKNNTLSELVFDLQAENTNILELHITKHTPNKRIWIIAFYPGFQFSINEQDVVSIKLQKKKTENKEGSIGRLYINSLDLTLNNVTRIYDDKNKTSPIAGYFNSNTVCSASLNLKQPIGNTPYSLNLGSFFITEIKSQEEKTTVEIKGQDYIGINKNKYISLGIKDETDAYSCFAKIANALNLSSSKIATELRQIKLHRIPLNGTVGSLLNKLCVITNAFCSCDETGSALIATPILARHGAVRYPVRYFFLDEYKGSLSGEKKNTSANIINLSYSSYEYEGEYQVGRRTHYLYATIGKSQFPQIYKNSPYGEYPIGGGLTPNLTKRFPLPDNFITIEFTDSFIPKAFEYQVEYEYDVNGRATFATVKLWNFIERTEGEQVTVMFMIKAKPIDVLLKKENFEVPKRPRNYIVPEKKAHLISSNNESVEEHNVNNKPFEFKTELKDAVSISRVEVANKFIQSKFEFVYQKTAEGITVRVWNYFPENPQTVTVNIYGSRLKPGTEKKTITARNEDDIQRNGEIIKNIEVGTLANDEVAIDVLKSMSYYYNHFSITTSIQTWSDPRLELYDLIAFKSLRGYGFTQGIIDEMELEYKGALTQKIKVKQTKKHNRDSRLFNGYVLNDRPVLKNDFLNYA